MKLKIVAMGRKIVGVCLSVIRVIRQFLLIAVILVSSIVLLYCKVLLFRYYPRNTNLKVHGRAQSQDFPNIALIDPFLDVITSVLGV